MLQVYLRLYPKKNKLLLSHFSGSCFNCGNPAAGVVEYFGEKLAGFAFTEKAWVASYGSRCVKPLLVYGDIEWTAPMTVKEVAEAQQLTSKYVKGMLTGLVTILNWSFIRDDISCE